MVSLPLYCYINGRVLKSFPNTFFLSWFCDDPEFPVVRKITKIGTKGAKSNPPRPNFRNGASSASII